MLPGGEGNIRPAGAGTLAGKRKIVGNGRGEAVGSNDMGRRSAGGTLG